MFNIEIALLLGRMIESLLNEIAIVGMNSLKRQVDRGSGRSIVFKDVVDFIRPVDLSADNTPAETARLAYPLALRKESFAALQIGIESGVKAPGVRLFSK
jgi:hypothetical protein